MRILPRKTVEDRQVWASKQQAEVVPQQTRRKARSKHLWVDPVRFLALIDGLSLAVWACTMAKHLRPALPGTRHPGGAPQIYHDESILLTMLVLIAWRLSLEKVDNWLRRYDGLAMALGMPADGRTISSAQLSRRSRQLGIWPYLFFFMAFVWQLLRLGAISGRQVILDASLLKTWYQDDPDADLAGRRGRLPTRGFKIHALVDRWSHLPLLVLITPASASELTLAPILLGAAVLVYGLHIAVVYADAAYFSRRFMGFVRSLGAIPVIDYNLGRKGKHFLATLFFIDQWRRLRSPRTVVERYFAFLKRYYGLKYFQVQGLPAVWRYALLVNASMLAVALVAFRSGRPDLMTSRSKVLAFT